MKLHEASTLVQYPNTKRAFDVLRRVKHDATMEDMEWFVSYTEGQIAFNSYNGKDMAHLFFTGTEGYKNNPKAVEGFWEGEFEWRIPEYGAEEALDRLEAEFKDFF